MLFAVAENRIDDVMHQKIHAIADLLKDKHTPLAKKKGKIFAIVDDLFDYRIMARIALGRKWKQLTPEQQSLFTKRFERKLKDSYFEKLKFYSDQKVVLKGHKKVKSNRIKLYSQIIGKDDVYDVVYKFYKDKKSNDWKIYDVDIAKVSMIQTYRKQFSDFLRHKSIDALIQTI
jgi:phospholipid transport system substrate-binding protein